MSKQADGYTFGLSDNVKRTRVTYKNRYGIEIAADLYAAKGLDESVEHAGLVVGPPHGGVKEQGPGVYANELAQRGFVVLAFDPSYNGESGGEPRHVTSPEIFAEDFSAGVDFLGTLRYVDREKIGVIGICGSGGFALSQASIDQRIKAVATSAMYDISGATRDGWMYEGSNEARRSMLATGSEQRWKDVDAGEPALQPQFPMEMPDEGLDPIIREFFEYYVKSNNRGWHPRSIGAFTLTSFPAHVNFGQFKSLADIAPRKVMLVTGDVAHSKWFSDKVHEQIPEISELVVVPGARHIDLYDDVNLIPFDRLNAFFAEQLGAPSRDAVRQIVGSQS
ncbi:MAG: alpha/beta hydrolase [Caldilineaceae bacterium]|nr:alpha/beta hydrolase [Caldilineaceae bacterium]